MKKKQVHIIFFTYRSISFSIEGKLRNGKLEAKGVAIKVESTHLAMKWGWQMRKVSFFVYLSVYAFVSLFVYVSVYVLVSSLFVYVFFCLCIFLSMSLIGRGENKMFCYLCQCFSLCHCFSLCLCIFLSMSLSLCGRGENKIVYQFFLCRVDDLHNCFRLSQSQNNNKNK